MGLRPSNSSHQRPLLAERTTRTEVAPPRMGHPLRPQACRLRSLLPHPTNHSRRRPQTVMRLQTPHHQPIFPRLRPVPLSLLRPDLAPTRHTLLPPFLQ